MLEGNGGYRMISSHTAGEILFNNGIPVKLISLAGGAGDDEFWWTETTFVDVPEKKLLAFNKHTTYRGLHTNTRQNPRKSS